MTVGLIPFGAGLKKYFMSACIWVASAERSIPKLTDLVAREILFFEDYDSRLQFIAGYWLEVALVPYHDSWLYQCQQDSRSTRRMEALVLYSWITYDVSHCDHITFTYDSSYVNHITCDVASHHFYHILCIRSKSPGLAHTQGWRIAEDMNTLTQGSYWEPPLTNSIIT